MVHVEEIGDGGSCVPAMGMSSAFRESRAAAIAKCPYHDDRLQSAAVVLMQGTD
ncbi:MAG: hypothetical protein U0941_26075 [Planctomycetaceae bacterium]